MISFGPWEIPDDLFLGECGSLDRAKKISSANVITFDLEQQTAVIQGSEWDPYFVSLNGCTCPIFRRNELPCKHMIWLALTCGMEFDVPQFDPYAASDYDIAEDIARLTSRWRSGQLTMDALTKCVSALKSSAAKAKHRPGRPKKK